ncbi:unnamed protein product [Rhizoctonia solani]|uniref:Uncharacterized protein n=1 Tax=Rhizoctonia solani TaxID=456999 RepID=A0A8H2XUP9_9AGAM|nr:unnamed protein product [Rhizoctonia solani]
MLVFMPPDTRQLFKSQFPVVWKVITFPAGEYGKASVRYVLRPAFGYGQVDQDYLFHPTGWAQAQNGDLVSISGSPGQLKFDENIKGDDPKHIACKNDTDNQIDLSVGIIKGSGANEKYEPTVVWTGVGAGANVTTQFRSKLSVYVTRDYKPNQMLRGEVETDVIWSHNLDEIDDVTSWIFVQDDDTGAFSIVSASKV